MESHIINGNNILEGYTKVSELAESIRENPKPILLEFRTFRMRGHEEASGAKYVPEELMDAWALKDPIENYRNFLIKEKILTPEEFKNEFKGIIQEHLNTTFEEAPITSSIEDELNDVYKTSSLETVAPNSVTENIRLIDAISKGLKQYMERYDDLVIIGQDVAEHGGVFKITEGFVEAFGKERVRNTPICESAIVSLSYGLVVNGMKAVMEMQFADFVSTGFNPIVNLLAKSHYRWNQKADVVIRMPCGAGVGAGTFHSQTNEAWFIKIPGLKVVYPAFPYDAKGLLTAAINDPNPVLFFEHKGLYRSTYQDVPTEYYTLPLGKAVVLKEGNEVTIISFGAAVYWTLETLEQVAVSADVIDLRSLQPLDTETIYNSVKKTGKVIILQEDSLFGSVSSDISSLIMENCFEYLDAPVKRVASIETPIPFAGNLEKEYLPKERFKEELLQLIAY